MKKKLLSAEDINTGRQTEADLAKFVCLTGMVIVHCFDVFVDFSEISSTVQYVFLIVLNSLFGAGTFMFCMGCQYLGDYRQKILQRRNDHSDGPDSLCVLLCTGRTAFEAETASRRVSRVTCIFTWYRKCRKR